MDNPLLPVAIPIPFDRIRPEHVEPAVDALIARTRDRVEAIAAPETPRTWDATAGALDGATEDLGRALGVVAHLEGVATTPALRDAHNRVRPKASALFSEMSTHEGLYAALRQVAERPEAARLDGPRARFLHKTLDDFRRNGAELPPEGKARLRDLDVELTRLTTQFAQNVLDATAAFELMVDDEDQLAGLPASVQRSAREAARSRGREGWRLTLQAPTVIAVLTYGQDRGLRERIWRAYNARATEGDRDNRPLLRRILALRQQKATLLGYGTFADLVTEDRMAKSGARARQFVDDLRRRTRPMFDRENAELEAFVRDELGHDGPIEPWDVGYFSEKLRRNRFDFDEEALRPYFPVTGVVDGMFRVVERLYGVRIEPRDMPTWHPDVRTYAVIDGDGTPLCSFYADLFPRDDKRGGAWMNGLAPSTFEGDRLEPGVGLFCANVTPPAGDGPALLTHREVETLFHEFGHLMHHALSRVPVRSLAGTRVAWDFVELPSQIMENWTWEREALDLFARHHETGEPIPDDLVDKLQRARTFRAANATMRQLGFATLDLVLHTEYAPSPEGDVMGVARRVLEEHAPTPLPADHAMVAGFTHLFASPVGYASGYYSYKWAEVLDADAFSRFAEEGIFNPATGRAFRETILEKGDSEDPLALFEAFRGRAPALEPLLARMGAVDAATPRSPAG
jgi:oligopeptidase A